MGTFATITDVLSPGERGSVRYRCSGCQRAFAYPAEVEEPDCPYCNESTLEPAPEP